MTNIILWQEDIFLSLVFTTLYLWQFWLNSSESIKGKVGLPVCDERLSEKFSQKWVQIKTMLQKLLKCLVAHAWLKNSEISSMSKA